MQKRQLRKAPTISRQELTRDVKSFWEIRAADPSLDATQVTHPDVWQRWLEIETIKRLLWRDAVVIDVGCGNGIATKQLAPLVKSIVGVDQSEGMIRRAKEEGALSSNATFAVADVLDLSPARVGTFDVALAIRCLINLPDWRMQQRALANIAGILKPGGLYIFVEGLREGRATLNCLRKSVGLAEMPVVWHNLDFEGERTLRFLDRWFTLEHQLGFGTYDLVAQGSTHSSWRPNNLNTAHTSTRSRPAWRSNARQTPLTAV